MVRTGRAHGDGPHHQQLVELLDVGELGHGRRLAVAAGKHLVQVHARHAPCRVLRVVVRLGVDDQRFQQRLHPLCHLILQRVQLGLVVDEVGNVVVGVEALVGKLQPFTDGDRQWPAFGRDVSALSPRRIHRQKMPCAPRNAQCLRRRRGSAPGRGMASLGLDGRLLSELGQRAFLAHGRRHARLSARRAVGIHLQILLIEQMAAALHLGEQVALVVGIDPALDPFTLHHVDAGVTQCGNLGRVVGQQVDVRAAQRLQHGGCHLEVALVHPEAQRVVGIQGVHPRILPPVGTQLVGDADAPPFLRQVQHDAAAVLRQPLHRAAQLIAAVTAQAAKEIARQARGMQPDPHRLLAVEVRIADDDGDMLEVAVLLAEDHEAAVDGVITISTSGKTARLGGIAPNCTDRLGPIPPGCSRPIGRPGAGQRHRGIADLLQLNGAGGHEGLHLRRVDMHQTGVQQGTCILRKQLAADHRRCQTGLTGQCQRLTGQRQGRIGPLWHRPPCPIVIRPRRLGLLARRPPVRSMGVPRQGHHAVAQRQRRLTRNRAFQSGIGPDP